MFSIFYYCYFDILLFEEISLNILKPFELVSHLYIAYPTYHNVIEE